ncbi:hypothetical protein [Streptomyces sp. NPDC054961]
MSNSEAENANISAGEGIQQIPARISVSEVPAVSDARDKLLAAIGTEAQTVAEKSTGQASTALAELARAYALVTGAAALSDITADGATVGARVSSFHDWTTSS